MCKYMFYESFKEGEMIFKEGDPSNDKFYVIINGSVSIFK